MCHIAAISVNSGKIFEPLAEQVDISGPLAEQAQQVDKKNHSEIFFY